MEALGVASTISVKTKLYAFFVRTRAGPTPAHWPVAGATTLQCEGGDNSRLSR